LVFLELDGEVWKYSRYFDNKQFWSSPDPLIPPPKDVMVTVEEGPLDIPGEHEVDATKRVKFIPKLEEFEMYNVTLDPLEVDNLHNHPSHVATQMLLAELLDEQRAQKRLRPISGDVPGQPV
jgi:choline-sulfatase